MGGPSTETTATTTPKDAKELRIAMPLPYNGERTKLKQFVSSVKLYLLVNSEVYKADHQKIAFLLSLLQDKQVALWKEQYLETNLDKLQSISWAEFLKEFETAFKESDTAANALWRIKNLQQGGRTAEDHVNEFKLLVSASGLLAGAEANDLAVRDYFSESLSIPLRRRILEDANQPASIQDWYDKAILYDNQWRRNRDVFGRARSAGGQSGNKPKKTWTWHQPTTTRDPNAMEVDALTVEERNDLMRRGACFFCRTPGHLAAKCPKKSGKPQTQSQRQKTPREIAAHIRAMLDEVGPEAEVEVRRIAAEEGF